MTDRRAECLMTNGAPNCFGCNNAQLISDDLLVVENRVRPSKAVIAESAALHGCPEGVLPRLVSNDRGELIAAPTYMEKEGSQYVRPPRFSALVRPATNG